MSGRCAAFSVPVNLFVTGVTPSTHQKAFSTRFVFYLTRLGPSLCASRHLAGLCGSRVPRNWSPAARTSTCAAALHTPPIVNFFHRGWQDAQLKRIAVGSFPNRITDLVMLPIVSTIIPKSHSFCSHKHQWPFIIRRDNKALL